MIKWIKYLIRIIDSKVKVVYCKNWNNLNSKSILILKCANIVLVVNSDEILLLVTYWINLFIIFTFSKLIFLVLAYFISTKSSHYYYYFLLLRKLLHSQNFSIRFSKFQIYFIYLFGSLFHLNLAILNSDLILKTMREISALGLLSFFEIFAQHWRMYLYFYYWNNPQSALFS